MGGWRLAVLGSILLVLLGSTACTRSLAVNYEPGMSRLVNAEMLTNATLGIGKFQDKRAWVKPDDAQSESFIASQGAWKFGVSSKGTDYVPAKTLVQDVFVTEFTKA